MLAEVLVTVKELSREVHFLKNELADIKTTLGESQGQPDLAPANKLPMQSMEDFNEVQTSLKSDVSVRQKMVIYFTKPIVQFRENLTVCMYHIYILKQLHIKSITDFCITAKYQPLLLLTLWK